MPMIAQMANLAMVLVFYQVYTDKLSLESRILLPSNSHFQSGAKIMKLPTVPLP